MENGSFIDDFSITTSIYEGFSMAMLNNQMVNDTRTCIMGLTMDDWDSWRRL
jgi:hypothetical protein